MISTGSIAIHKSTAFAGAAENNDQKTVAKINSQHLFRTTRSLLQRQVPSYLLLPLLVVTSHDSTKHTPNTKAHTLIHLLCSSDVT